ncbi:MAG: sulfatase [Candidatus Aminicenantes bacterium]|nr:sulfatase [Candidatus Aminicenantes bacterium]
MILADDLGYGDIGCFGSTTHRTPNLDRLAAQGVRMTSFYSTSGVCTPSRASLMTGCYPRRIDMHEDEAGDWVLFPVSRKGLNPGEVTIAEVLKKSVYATSCVGKWHLGDQPPFLPTRQGFDEYFGIPYSNDMGAEQGRQNPPLPLLRNEDVIEAPVDQDTLTERYTAEAVRFIADHKDGPFFLYLAQAMPHTPLHSGERFRGKSAAGRYGDAVEELDWSTGEILAALEKLGLDERTLVVFTSDNGGVRPANNAPLSGTKGGTAEGSMRVPCIIRRPGRIPAGKECRSLATMMDFLPTFAHLAGAAAPSDRIIDGKDIRTLIEKPDASKTPYEVFYYFYMGQLQAVRSGSWKLHLPLREKRHGWRKPPIEEPGRLYDLDADPAESKDLIKEHPDVVARFLALAERAREDLGDGDKPGKHQRPAGWVDIARPLTKAPGPGR